MAFKGKITQRFKRQPAHTHGKDVCIIDTASLAGSKQIEDFVEVAASLKPSDRLVLKRDRGNKFDEWSVNVFTADGVRIGLLPWGENEIVARLLDSHRAVYGRVKQLEKRNSWMNLEMRIFLAS